MVRQRVDLPEPEGPRDDDPTFSHGKIDVLQNVVGAVVLVDVGDFDEVFCASELPVRHFEPFHVRCVYDAGCLYAEFSAYASWRFPVCKIFTLLRKQCEF